MEVLPQKKPRITHTWILDSIDGSRGRKERDFSSFLGFFHRCYHCDRCKYVWDD
jgi:hypothetical protein